MHLHMMRKNTEELNKQNAKLRNNVIFAKKKKKKKNKKKKLKKKKKCYNRKKKKKKNPKNNIDVKLVNTCFNLEEQFLQENESQESENLKMLRKSPALNA